MGEEAAGILKGRLMFFGEQNQNKLKFPNFSEEAILGATNMAEGLVYVNILF